MCFLIIPLSRFATDQRVYDIIKAVSAGKTDV
jgi:hypothetical protein